MTIILGFANILDSFQTCFEKLIYSHVIYRKNTAQLSPAGLVTETSFSYPVKLRMNLSFPISS
jgi:hypothetical protein